MKPSRAPRLGTRISLASVIFDGDRDLRAEIEQSREVARLLSSVDGEAVQRAATERRAALLRNGMRLTPALAPRVYRAVDRCRDVLGLEAPVEIFCEQEAQANAYVLPPREPRLTIALSSAALEMLDQAELCAVIGHELGHVLLGHFDLRPLAALTEDERLPPIAAMRFFAWMRYAELSADRVGLLCCDSFDTAISAHFKMVSGLSDPRLLGDIRETATQYASLRAEAIEQDPRDWFATHPYSPLRIKSLDLFRHSKTYHRLLGREGGTLGDRELEAEVAQVVSLMNPAGLHEKGTFRREVRELLACGGIAVALADKRLQRSELEAVRRLVGDGRLLDEIDELTSMSERKRAERIASLAGVLSVQLSPIRRRKIVEDLSAIALSDKAVTETERETLYEIAAQLGVDAMFVDECLCRPDRALD